MLVVLDDVDDAAAAAAAAAGDFLMEFPGDILGDDLSDSSPVEEGEALGMLTLILAFPG